MNLYSTHDGSATFEYGQETLPPESPITDAVIGLAESVAEDIALWGASAVCLALSDVLSEMSDDNAWHDESLADVLAYASNHVARAAGALEHVESHERRPAPPDCHPVTTHNLRSPAYRAKHGGRDVGDDYRNRNLG